MDLKDLDRIHKEQEERRKFSSILHRFDEKKNLRNGFIVIVVVIILVILLYGVKEMNFLFDAVPGDDPVEQVTPQESEPE